MRASPWEEVAVNVRTPAAEDPMQQAMAECSDSTGMNLAFSLPSAQRTESSSTIVVWGVIG